MESHRERYRLDQRHGIRSRIATIARDRPDTDHANQDGRAARQPARRCGQEDVGGYRLGRRGGSGAGGRERHRCDADEGEEAGLVPGARGGDVRVEPDDQGDTAMNTWRLAVGEMAPRSR